MARLQRCHCCNENGSLMARSLGQEWTPAGLTVTCELVCLACGASYCTFSRVGLTEGNSRDTVPLVKREAT